jgi:hypothetical protein
MFRGLLARGRLALPVAVALLCVPTGLLRAQPAEGDGGELAWSMGTGCGLALGSMAAGGAIAGLGAGNRPRRTGIEIVSVGLALAPGISHAMAREWKRAALFGGTGLALATFNVILIEKSTAVLDHGPPSSRIPFGIVLATQMLVTTVGLADSLMARERKAGQRLAVLPLVDGRALGLSMGGPL